MHNFFKAYPFLVSDTVDSLAGPPERCVRVRYTDPAETAAVRANPRRGKQRERPNGRREGRRGGGKVDPKTYFGDDDDDDDDEECG